MTIEGNNKINLKSKIHFVKGLKPLVAGGDGKAMHVLNETNYGFELKESVQKHKAKLGFYILSLVLICISFYLLVIGHFIDGFFLGAFGVGSLFVARKGTGFGRYEINIETKKITRNDKDNKECIDFSELKYLEVISKLRAVGNGQVSKTNELNIALKSNRRVHITTGNDSNIIAQADIIAYAVGVDIMYDNEKVYR